MPTPKASTRAPGAELIGDRALVGMQPSVVLDGLDLEIVEAVVGTVVVAVVNLQGRIGEHPRVPGEHAMLEDVAIDACERMRRCPHIDVTIVSEPTRKR